MYMSQQVIKATTTALLSVRTSTNASVTVPLNSTSSPVCSALSAPDDSGILFCCSSLSFIVSSSSLVVIVNFVIDDVS